MTSRTQPSMVGGYECPDHGNFAPNAWCPRCKIEEAEAQVANAWCPRCKIEEAEAQVANERDRYKADYNRLLFALRGEIERLREPGRGFEEMQIEAAIADRLQAIEHLYPEAA